MEIEKYRTGIIDIDIGDKEPLHIVPEASDLGKLRGLGKILDPEEHLNKSLEIVRGILKRSYPDVPDKVIESILMQKHMKIISELFIAFGWITRKRVEEIDKETEKKSTNP